MEPDRYFIATAQISLAIAGFAGIVAAYRSESVHDWGKVERLWLRLLLFNAILPFTFSLAGIFVLAADLFPVSRWRWLSAFAAICLLPYAVTIIRRVSGLTPGALTEAGSSPFVSYGLVFILIAVCLLQLWNAVIGSAFWAFFGAIVSLIIGAVFQFVRLVLKPQRPDRSETASGEEN